jgi:hypothetical protein
MPRVRSERARGDMPPAIDIGDFSFSPLITFIVFRRLHYFDIFSHFDYHILSFIAASLFHSSAIIEIDASFPRRLFRHVFRLFTISIISPFAAFAIPDTDDTPP